ncbi:hypothetical protein HYE82_26720 [Streptomyces sp. BR123]|uniref:hypothetical protein n=1 Tax=Streptomyces sp. BR123 TaxID=2749828 RepID=UPI0015C48666|nr:hypothetical protein [Streptomyces sp. BR123]NXY97903.1 hypothetical protein [Streptomyces sp. BR123]
MTHPFRTKRLVLFAASTAMAAGGVLVPGTAFAATPATPHTVTVRGDDISGGDTSTLLFLGEPDNAIQVAPDKDLPGKGGTGKKSEGKWGKNRPGKGGSSEGTGAKVPEKPDWQCVTTPCGPPDDVRTEVVPGSAEGARVSARS